MFLNHHKLIVLLLSIIILLLLTLNYHKFIGCKDFEIIKYVKETLSFNKTLGYSSSSAKKLRNFTHDFQKSVDFVSRNLVKPAGPGKLLLTQTNLKDYSQSKQTSQLLRRFFKHKRNGKFLEVGAYDGEMLSNSLSLEKDYAWSGVLIEADPENFEMLKKKQRNSYLLSACLSNVQQPTETMIKVASHGTLNRIESKVTNGPGRMHKIMCVPIQAIFEALGWYEFDLVTLDIEGFELEALRTIVWSRMKIDYFQIEADKVDNKVLIEFMDNVGYQKVDKLHVDLIFARKNLTVIS